MSNHVLHVEPECRNNLCGHAERHNHGFNCELECSECFGYCHPACPAYRGGRGLEDLMFIKYVLLRNERFKLAPDPQEIVNFMNATTEQRRKQIALARAEDQKLRSRQNV